MWLVVAVAGALAVATGLLPWSAAVELTQRVGPVLGFLASVTVLAELCDAAGLFAVLGRRAARLAGGSAHRMLLLVCLLATATTVLLSLDTTAVLLTPVVLAVATATELDPRPLAYATVWLANGASLLLPVSNLTNLLALDRLGRLGTLGFARRMLLPEAVAVLVVVLAVLVLFRSRLRAPARPPDSYRAQDPLLLRLSAGCAAAVAPVSLAGVAPWQVTTPAAGLLALAFALRRPSALRLSLLPWRVLLLTEGLFLVVGTLGRHGLDSLLARATAGGPFATELASAGLANLTNNLPSYLAFERAVPAGHTDSLLSLLVGSNAGPLVLVTGSLATILWRERCAAAGLRIGAGEFARYGLLVAPLLLLGCYAALLASR